MEAFIDDVYNSVQMTYDVLVQWMNHYTSDGSNLQNAIQQGLQRSICYLYKHTSLEPTVQETFKQACLEEHQRSPFKKVAIRWSQTSFQTLITKHRLIDLVQGWKASLQEFHSRSSRRTSQLKIKYAFPDTDPKTLYAIEQYLTKFIRWLSSQFFFDLKKECHQMYYEQVTSSTPLRTIHRDIAKIDQLLIQLQQTLVQEVKPMLLFLESPDYTGKDLYASLQKELRRSSSQSGGFFRTKLHKKLFKTYQFQVTHRLSIFGTIKAEYKDLSIFDSGVSAATLPIHLIQIAKTTIVSSAFTALLLPLKLTLMIPLLPQLALDPKSFLQTLIS